jgi:hypothetical protein
MASFALSIVIMFVVVGVLAGWAVREDRRRRASAGEE